jgi:hypothetical protein
MYRSYVLTVGERVLASAVVSSGSEIFLLFGYPLEPYNYFAVHESKELCNVSKKQQ